MAGKYSKVAEQVSLLEDERNHLISSLQENETREAVLEATLEEIQNELREVRNEETESAKKAEELEQRLKEHQEEAKVVSEENERLKKSSLEADAKVKEIEAGRKQLEEVITKNESQLNALQEENQQLLAEKQSKDLRLAELKTRLEQAQYIHKEKVSKTLNESFELREENSSLWNDIERLNEALERKAEEQQGMLASFIVTVQSTKINRLQYSSSIWSEFHLVSLLL